ncbi:MAG: hypothetical protein ACFFBE_10850 [Promethearchaeota archaeon]
MLKQRQWLVEHKEMITMSPKEYYLKMFEELIQEINENKKKLKN